MYPDSARALALVGCVLFGLISLSGMSGGRGVPPMGGSRRVNGRTSLVLAVAILAVLAAVGFSVVSGSGLGANPIVALAMCGATLGGLALFIGRMNGHPVLRSPLAGGAFVLTSTGLALPGTVEVATLVEGLHMVSGIVLAALSCAVGLLSFRRALRRDDGGQFALLVASVFLLAGLIVPWGGLDGAWRPFQAIDGLTGVPISVSVEVASLNGGGSYVTETPLMVGHDSLDSIRIGTLFAAFFAALIWAMQWARPSRPMRLAHFFSLFGVGALALFYLGGLGWALGSGERIPDEELSTWSEWLAHWVTHSSATGAFQIQGSSPESLPMTEFGFQTGVEVWFGALSTIPLWCIAAAYRVRFLTSPVRNQQANSERKALVNAESGLSVWVLLVGVVWIVLAAGIGWLESGGIFLADPRVALALGTLGCAAVVLTETDGEPNGELRSQIAGVVMALLGLVFLVGSHFGWTARSIYMLALG